MENLIKEGKLALRWTRLSCHAFRDNAVRLQLFALAYKLARETYKFDVASAPAGAGTRDSALAGATA